MDNWATPSWVMKMFMGWHDPCPLASIPETDGLKIEWGDKTFVNPPYSNPLPWVEKAIEESKKGNMIVMLLNVDTSTKWFAKLNEANAHFIWFSERLKFSGKDASPRPSMLVVLEGKDTPEPDCEPDNTREGVIKEVHKDYLNKDGGEK